MVLGWPQGQQGKPVGLASCSAVPASVWAGIFLEQGQPGLGASAR